MLAAIYGFIQALIGMAILTVTVIVIIAIIQTIFGKGDK